MNPPPFHPRWRLALFVLIAAAHATSPASAQPKAAQAAAQPKAAQPKTAQPKAAPPPAATAAAAPQDEVTALFKQAEAARDAGKFEEAATLLRKAWGLRKTWDIAGNLGLNEKKLGRLPEAAEHLTFALANLPPTSDEDAREGLTKALAAVRAEVAALNLTVDVDGAQVRVGGEAKGVSPIANELFVMPGSVAVEVKKDGYETATQTVEMKKGAAQEMSFRLVPIPTATPERTRLPIFLLGGAAVVVAGAGAGLFGAYTSKRDDGGKLKQDILDAKHSCVTGAANFDARCKDVESAARTGDAFNRAGIGMLIGGGVLAAGALAWWLWPQDKARQTGAQIVPIVSTTGGGFVASGSW